MRLVVASVISGYLSSIEAADEAINIKAFFWVRPLARSPQIAPASAKPDMIRSSDCAQLRPMKKYHCSE